MKVLFVVTAFYPEQAIGAIRVTKLAKYLQEQGVSITVVSLQPSPWAAKDETLYFEGLQRIQWDVIDQSTIFKKLFQKARVAAIGSRPANAGTSVCSTRATLKTRLRLSAQLAYTLLKAIDWSFLVRKHAKEYLVKEKFDFIFCSYPSVASPLSGIMLKRLGFGKNLVVDFRDPVVTRQGVGFGVKKWLQLRMLRAADLRLYVSEGVRRVINSNPEDKRDLVANNGFDPNDAVGIAFTVAKEFTAKALRVVYTGAMYGGKRNVRPIFQAATKILARSGVEHNFEQIIFEYAGGEGEIFHSQAEEFGLQDRVIDHGRLSRAGALALQRHADICLLATWNSASDQGVLTGKVFEYFMLKKPVVAIVGGDLNGSEIAEVIRTTGAGCCFESAAPDSITELEDWLEKALDEKKATGFVQQKYNEAVNDFEIKTITARIYKKMDEVLKV